VLQVAVHDDDVIAVGVIETGYERLGFSIISLQVNHGDPVVVIRDFAEE